MNTLDFKAFHEQLSMLLRDQRPGTTADLTEYALAYWNGRRVVGLFLREDNSGLLDEDFELDETAWDNWHNELSRWHDAPRFSFRAELLSWLNEMPPHETGL